MLAALLALWLPVELMGQLDADKAQGQPPLKTPASVPAGLPPLDTSCPSAEAFGGSEVEQSAWCASQLRQYVSMRTLADRALQESATSFRAHFLMGYAQHFGEGNLPKALYHLEEAEKNFIDAFGPVPDKEKSPWKVYFRILHELVYVHGEMDHHETKIRYVDALSERLEMDYEPLKAWPLLKLKRFEEARLIATAAIEKDDRWNQAVGYTALCAVESEARNRIAAYEACQAAARPVMKSRDDGAVELSNAAASAEEIYRFDEAERLYTEATRRPPEGSVNPWGRLVRLYLRQSRLAEAVDSWRRMRAYRASRPGSYLDQQDQSEAELIGASVLLVAGRGDAAEPITARTVARPDRQGTSSAASEQNEAGAWLMDRVAKLTRARMLEEAASWSPFPEALELRVEALVLRWRAWRSGRAAAEILADPERLLTTLRPECPGSIELPPWLDAEVISVVGPGVALAAVAQSRIDETLPPELSWPVFAGLEAEAELLAGEPERALERADEALGALLSIENLVRARVAAIGAEAAWKLGETSRARAFLLEVLRTDPGVLVRLGLRFPVRLTARGNEPEVAVALDLLEDSPRFEQTRWGFHLEVGSDEAQLRLEDGTVLTSMRYAGGPDGVEARARRIVRALHRRLLVPEVDITQADIRSLDGSLGTGGRASDRVQQILNEVEKP